MKPTFIATFSVDTNYRGSAITPKSQFLCLASDVFLASTLRKNSHRWNITGGIIHISPAGLEIIHLRLLFCMAAIPSKCVRDCAMLGLRRKEGPAEWGDRSTFATCSMGHAQSPIDIKGAMVADLPAEI
jgi:hypothetical protein